MGASIVVTMEWIDKALSWETGKGSTILGQPAASSRTTDQQPSTTVSTTITTTTTSTSSTPPADSGTAQSSSTQSISTDEKVININSIRADRSQVWIPEIEVINRVNDFSPVDEKQQQLKIESNGKVKYSRSYRMRSMMSSSLSYYPYDVQEMLKYLFSFHIKLNENVT